MKKLKIVIIDDHTLIRETWSFTLNSITDLKVVGEAGSAEEGLKLVKRLRPHVVLMDINLPGMNGIEATTKIRTLCPQTKVLGVSLHCQLTYAKTMIQAGASGYVTKNSSREEMLIAIYEIAKGNRYICREIKEIVCEKMLIVTDKETNVSRLSKRQIEIIYNIKQGRSSKDIAEALFISATTVDVHRHKILKKLNLKNTAALINFVKENCQFFELHR